MISNLIIKAMENFFLQKLNQNDINWRSILKTVNLENRKSQQIIIYTTTTDGHEITKFYEIH